MYHKVIKNIGLTLLVGWFSHKASAQSVPFVQVDIIKTSGVATEGQIDGLGINNKQTVRYYMDGLGRAVQTVALKSGANTGMDVVAPVAYDTLGRQIKSYLPYLESDSSGSYRSGALTSQGSYYTTTSDKVAHDASPYSQQLFENSPIQRILSQGSVGAGFQVGSGQHYQSMIYRPNTITDSVAITYPDGSFSGTYGANTLSVTDATDADGGEVLVFKDKLGRVVLKKQLASGSAYNYTYYIYNNAGAISYVVPPKASHLILVNGYTLTQTAVSHLIFKYVYDSLGRLIEKTVPGAAVMYIVYDPLNRPVLMQDGNLRAGNQWNYVKYDAKGRAISQGIYTDTSPADTSRTGMQSYVSGLSGYSTAWYETRTSSASFSNYYTNNIFPTTNITPLAFSYYDDYDLTQSGSALYTYQSQGLTGEATSTKLTRGLLTITLTRSVGPGFSNIWLTKAYFYDKRGNVIQVYSNNQLNYTFNTLTDTKTMVPDFTGKALVSKVVKVTSSSNTIITTPTYDSHNSRVIAVDQKYNSQTTIRIAAYSYNELGQLINKKLGNTSGSSYLQSLDYLYNIHGQLLTINSNKLTGTYSAAAFGMQLLYDQADATIGNTASFTGRVTGVKWMTKDGTGTTNTNERSYKYSYDVLNRITAANYAERLATDAGNFTLNSGGFDESGITYDENGNIKALLRNSSTVGGSSHTNIDNLTYTYDSTNPNRLQSVADASGNASGFMAGSGNYAYDAAGNLKTDPYKGLHISYNVLNRTDTIKVTTATNRFINYTYDASGTLIRKQQYDNNTIQATTDYIDGFVYIGGTISYASMPEGRVRNTGSALKPEYVITDQQGNARLSFEDSGSGTTTIRQENSYYAFGMTMISAVSIPGMPNKQLYNGGSEWQNDYTSLPDYYQTFYRNYDAALGRFIAVDPEPEKDESTTTYNYSGNNPIMFNDILGNTKYQYSPPVSYVTGLTDGTNRMPGDDLFDGLSGTGGGGGAFGWASSISSDVSAYSAESDYNNFLNDVLTDAVSYLKSSGPDVHADLNSTQIAGLYNKWQTSGDNGSIATAIINSDYILQGSAGSDANGVIGGYYHTSDGQPTTINNVSGTFAAVHFYGGAQSTVVGSLRDANQGGSESNGKAFDVSEVLDKSLNLTTDAIVGAQAVAGVGWKQMVREVPILKQLGVAAGIVGFANHAVNFYKNPNWKDGLEMAGQLGVWGLKIAFPESYIIDAVEFGYNNGTMVFDTIWDHIHK
ncbi:MAG: DUF6443 domain-containing protein [Sphingobacteriales bacterium]